MISCCEREGDLKAAADDSVDEIDVFDGRHNRIAFEQVKLKLKSINYRINKIEKIKLR